MTQTKFHKDALLLVMDVVFVTFVCRTNFCAP